MALLIMPGFKKMKEELGDNNIELSVTWHFESVSKKLMRILLM